MHEFYHQWESPRLGEKFEVLQFGAGGKPMLAFPSSDGRFFDYRNHGMIDACRDLIEAGRLQVWCVDGRDWESWSNTAVGSHDRARRHNQWEACVLEELLPIVHQINPRAKKNDLIVTGCSGGAFHAANFMFRHPAICDNAILLSGVYSTFYFRADQHDDSDYANPDVYLNNPSRYLAALDDEYFLSHLRQNKIILCCGQGDYETECLRETRALAAALEKKKITHWLDIWGEDVSHDWPWWQKQLAYFLQRLEV